MENSKLQSTFTLINSIKFEEKIDIDDLVLPPKQTGTSNIKQEPVENFRSEMEKEITLLFEELDMMSLYDYDKMRVKKVEELFEKYHQALCSREQGNSAVETIEKNLEAKTTELTKLEQKFQIVENELEEKSRQMSIEISSLQKKIVEITEEHKAVMVLNSKTMNSIVTMHEKTLEDKTKELELAKSTNLSLSKKIQELESIQTLRNKENSNKPESVSESNEKRIMLKQGKAQIYTMKTDFKQKLFRCESCDASFNSQSEFIDHVTIVHEGKKTRECIICGLPFLLPEDFLDHVTNFHEGKKPQECDKAYQESLRCKICAKKLPNKVSLNSHIKGVHGTKKFECGICHKKFSVNDHLKSHSITHTEQKLFSCKSCRKEFKHRASLNVHAKGRCKAKVLLQEELTK